MLGINKRLDQIEYRLARIDKMLEDMMTVPKQVPSVVVHKPVSDTRQRKTDWYPSGMAQYMRTRYRTVDDIIAKFGYAQESVRTYLKNIRKAGLPVKTRGRAPTQYKIANPHNNSTAMQIITGEKPNG